MVRLKGPMMSIEASGTYGGVIVFATWKGIAYARKHVIPTYSNTTAQQNVRSIVTESSKAWKASATVGTIAINTAYKGKYDTSSSKMAMSGFNLFLKETMALNNSTLYDGTLVINTQPIGYVAP